MRRTSKIRLRPTPIGRDRQRWMSLSRGIMRKADQGKMEEDSGNRAVAMGHLVHARAD
jgi:hypothetical protein